MTANEAAKACMELVAKCLDEFYAVTSPEMAEIERGFTEIISQVTLRDPLVAAALQVEQCEHNAAFDRWQRDNGWLPQEIEEPRPQSWWKRWLA